MYPYIITVLISAFGSFFYRKKYDLLISDFLFIILLSLVSLRGSGFGLADYENYKSFYSLVLTWNDVITTSVPAEIGFRFFSYIGNQLEFGPQFIIAIMGLLSTTPIYYLIRKYSEYKVLAIYFWLPYFLTFNMHTSRTAVAAGLGVLFIHFFFRKKYFLSLLLFLSAFSFHKASLVLLLVLLSVFSIKIVFITLIMAFWFTAFFAPLDFAIYFLNKFGMGALSNKVSAYRGGYFGYSISLYDPRIVLGVIISFLGFRIRNNLSAFNSYYLKIFMIGVLVLISFSEVVIMAWRSSYYFLLSGVIVIPFLAKYYNIKVYSKVKLKMSLSVFFILSYGSYLVWLIIRGQPYSFFFI